MEAPDVLSRRCYRRMPGSDEYHPSMTASGAKNTTSASTVVQFTTQGAYFYRVFSFFHLLSDPTPLPMI